MFELLPFLYSYLVDLFASWMIVLAIFFFIFIDVMCEIVLPQDVEWL